MEQQGDGVLSTTKNAVEPQSGVLCVGTEDDHLQLSMLGYKQELYRGFSGFMAFAFCFTSVSVIPSISLGFTTSVGIGGPSEIVWGWVIGSIFCIVAGASMAEISSVYPSAGSVYHWAGQISPPDWSRISSYICGWFNMLGNIGGDVAFASGFSTSIVFARNIAYPDEKPLSTEVQVAMSIAAIGIWSLMCLARTDTIGWISNFAVFWQLGGSMVIVISLLVLAPAHPSADDVFLKGIDRTNVTQSSDIPYLGMPVPAYTVVLGITNCLFAFTGYEAGAHMAEETCDARTAAPRSIMGTVLCTAVFGFIYILGMLFSTSDVTALSIPVQEIYSGAAGQQGGLGLMLLLVVCLFFAGQSATMVTSRIIFALARDGAIPLSDHLCGVNSTSHVPTRAVLATFVVDAVLMLLPLVNTSALAALTGTCTVGLQISYAIPIILRCTVGRSRWRPGVWNLGRMSLPIAITAATWQVVTSVLFLLPFVFPVNFENMNWTAVVVFSTLFLAGIYWLVGARHHYRGPCIVEEGKEAQACPELDKSDNHNTECSTGKKAEVGFLSTITVCQIA